MAISSKSKSFSRRSAGALLLVGVLAGVTVGGGVGVIAASTSKSVTVCVDKNDQHMNYSKSGKCKSHQTKLVLNQTGAKGIAGTNGTNGAAGAKGDTGAAGAKGDTGAAGAKGADGTAGTNGTNGTNGTDGAAGTNGTNGAGVAITQQSVCDGTDVDTVANEVCKIGMTGPGGGHVFLVDYYDQYAGFDYLEAVPVACEASLNWSVADTAVTAARGWAARAVGAGQANTTAILAVFTTATTSNNAAKYADSLTCGTKTDWFLGSIGEMQLMFDNLQGLGGFASGYYWSSTEDSDSTKALHQSFHKQQTWSETKSFATSSVRPVRAF
jgi:hypothetical protein